ncbi:E1-E2 ATPase [Leptospira interrogans str. L1207]|nr:E1-E2 ATPase [Leptospira interrogans str. L1207]
MEIEKDKLSHFWNLTSNECLTLTQSNRNGLSEEEAKKRLLQFGENKLSSKKETTAIGLFFSQFKSPIVLLLLFAAGLSVIVQDSVDAIIILGIVFLSGLLGFWQEKGAMNAVRKLLAMVQIRVSVMCNSSIREIPSKEVVPGDILKLSAGDMIPADCILLESKDLFVNEATLTGETFPIEKFIETISKNSSLSQRTTNSLWMGTHVVSGEAIALVIQTGKKTEFGKISERLKLRSMETEFEVGVRKFGFFLLHVTLLLVITIFIANVFLHKSVLESFLFSLALSVPPSTSSCDYKR